jgi:hypothetical protein
MVDTVLWAGLDGSGWDSSHVLISPTVHSPSAHTACMISPSALVRFFMVYAVDNTKIKLSFMFVN